MYFINKKNNESISVDSKVSDTDYAQLTHHHYKVPEFFFFLRIIQTGESSESCCGCVGEATTTRELLPRHTDLRSTFNCSSTAQIWDMNPVYQTLADQSRSPGSF